MSQINVTPLADVMIVLLIVMMVAAPLIERERTLRLRLALRGNASLWLGERAFPDTASLREVLRERLAAQPEGQRVVWLAADQDVSYREVDAALQLCRGAGAEQVALLAERLQEAS